MSQYRSNPEESPEEEAIIPPKPRRPLTCYGIFSVLERNFIWQQDTKQSTNVPSYNTSDDPYAAIRPQRYRSLVLPSNWFKVGMNRKKRSEHVNHGVISFEEMTKVIAERWKSADVETKAFCEVIANDERERHKIELTAYKETYGEDAVKTRTKNLAKSHKKRSAMEGCHSGGSSHSLNTDRNFIDSCKSYDREYHNVSYATYTAESRSKSLKSQFGGELFSDYLPDNVPDELALVGNNYDNILPGEELYKTFESNEE